MRSFGEEPFFLIVFGAGFLLGTIRVQLLLPVLGEQAAELLEMPFMLIDMVLAARWIDRWFLSSVDDRGRIVVGGAGDRIGLERRVCRRHRSSWHDATRCAVRQRSGFGHGLLPQPAALRRHALVHRATPPVIRTA